MAEHRVARPPLVRSDEANEVAKWALRELEKLQHLVEQGSRFQYDVLHVEPTKPREGMQVYADGTDWNPGSGAGLYVYKSGAWVKVFEGTLPTTNAYDEATDGVTTAAAAGGDVLKFRAGVPLVAAVQSNDVTHGDNVRYTIDFSLLSADTSVALTDEVAITGVAGAGARMLVTDLLKIINSLTEKTSVADDDKFLLMDSAAADVAKYGKWATLKHRTWVGIIKGTDEQIATDTTYSDDAVLVIPVEANTKYVVRYRLRWVNSGAAPDFKWQWVGPAASVAFDEVALSGPANGNFTIGYHVTALATSTAITTSGIAVGFKLEGTLMFENGANAGTLALQWAQNTSSAQTVTMKAESWLDYKKV